MRQLMLGLLSVGMCCSGVSGQTKFVDDFQSSITAEAAGVKYLELSSRGDLTAINAVATMANGHLKISGIKGEVGRVHVQGIGADNISVTLRAEFVNRGDETPTYRPRHTLGLMLRSLPKSNFGSGQKNDADSGYVAVEFLNNGGLLVRQRTVGGKLKFISSTKANLITGKSLYEIASGELGEQLNGMPFDLNNNGVLGENEPFDFNVELRGHHIVVRVNGEVLYSGSLELAAGLGGNEVSVFKGRPGKFELASDILVHKLAIETLEEDLQAVPSAVEPPKSGMYLQVDRVSKIWDAAPHQAFTDLIRYNGEWVCAFREADSHDGGIPGSRLRILTSPDAKTWTDAGTLADPRGDIRDAKLSITPDGRLMILTAIQLYGQMPEAPRQHQSIAFFTKDASSWSGPIDVLQDGHWLWGLTWQNQIGYSIGYHAELGTAHLYTTPDGLTFTRLVQDIQAHTGEPNESAIAFDGDQAYAVIRTMKEAYFGKAEKPFTAWTWTSLGQKVGGPELVRLSNGALLTAGRLYSDTGAQSTSLWWTDPETSELSEAVRLVSGGDTSYPGVVEYQDKLYVSYYSSHEGKTSIYFAVLNMVPLASISNSSAATTAATAEKKSVESEPAYFIYEPTVIPEDGPRLLVYLYGAGGSAKNFNLKRESYDQLRDTLLAHGYYILVPELGRYHFMNSAARDKLDALVETIKSKYGIQRDSIDLMGTSMGAGSVLAYASMHPQQTRSICAVMPMTDMARWTIEKPKYLARLTEAYGGTPEETPTVYKQHSALHRLEELAGIPILLIHGTEDTVVLPRHSQQLYQERLSRGDPTVMILVDNGHHRDDIVTGYQTELSSFILDPLANMP